MAAEKPETILRFSVFERPETSQVLHHVEKKFQRLYLFFSSTDCRMAPKSMFCDVALNRKWKYAGRNMAATKPEVIISQYAGELEKQFERINPHFQGRADQMH